MMNDTIIRAMLDNSNYIAVKYNIEITCPNSEFLDNCKKLGVRMHIPTLTSDAGLRLINVDDRIVKVYLDTVARWLNAPDLFLNFTNNLSHRWQIPEEVVNNAQFA